MTTVKHCDLCDLCDLPFNQCAHGLTKRQPKSTPSPRTKKSTPKKAAPRRAMKTVRARATAVPSVVSTVSLRPQREAMVTKSKCSNCGNKARFGRYSVCSNCLVKQGGRLCTACGRLFRPDAQSGKKAKCASCRRGRKKPKSAFVVAQAGSPGLGKRARTMEAPRFLSGISEPPTHSR